MIAILAESYHEVTTFVQRKHLMPESYVWCNTVDNRHDVNRLMEVKS